MSFTRRKFVLGMGTVIFFSGPGQTLLAKTTAGGPVRYVMIHDESRCNGCNLCTRACRKTNHVPAQGSRLSIAHIPVSDNDNETLYHYFRQSCQHCDDAPCIEVCPTGASWRDEDGSSASTVHAALVAVTALARVPTVRYLNPITKVADKCDFAPSPGWPKVFRLSVSLPVLSMRCCLVARTARRSSAGCRKIITTSINFRARVSPICIVGSVNI